LALNASWWRLLNAANHEEFTLKREVAYLKITCKFALGEQYGLQDLKVQFNNKDNILKALNKQMIA